MFINRALKAFVEQNNIQWQAFRDDKLWLPDVRILISMNEHHLRGLYSHYAKQTKGTGNKTYNAEYLDLRDCEAMLLPSARQKTSWLEISPA